MRAIAPRKKRRVLRDASGSVFSESGFGPAMYICDSASLDETTSAFRISMRSSGLSFSSRKNGGHLVEYVVAALEVPEDSVFAVEMGRVCKQNRERGAATVLVVLPTRHRHHAASMDELARLQGELRIAVLCASDKGSHR